MDTTTSRRQLLSQLAIGTGAVAIGGGAVELLTSMANAQIPVPEAKPVAPPKSAEAALTFKPAAPPSSLNQDVLIFKWQDKKGRTVGAVFEVREADTSYNNSAPEAMFLQVHGRQEEVMLLTWSQDKENGKLTESGKYKIFDPATG
jgi:hypothetical protein